MDFYPIIQGFLHSCFPSSTADHPAFIGMKELRAFFQRANVKLSNARLKELVQVFV